MDYGNNASRLRNHINLSHYKFGYNYRCEKCDMMFKQEQDWKNHVETCTGKTQKCKQCSRYVEDMSTHHHTMKCDICDTEFSRHYLYKVHRATMHKELKAKVICENGSYVCSLCGMDFGKEYYKTTSHITQEHKK